MVFKLTFSLARDPGLGLSLEQEDVSLIASLVDCERVCLCV